MDGVFHGKPYEQMDDLGVPLFLVQHPCFQKASTKCIPVLHHNAKPQLVEVQIEEHMSQDTALPVAD